jgi:hypothetical protein
MAGTKKQKMDISKAIVKAIYSLDPPGRFLKQCPATGQWNELSKRDAADKAAQAMAYAVSGEEKSKRRKERRRQSRRSLPLTRDDAVDAVSSQPVDRSAPLHLHSSTNHLEGNASSSAARNRLATRGSAAADTNNVESSAFNVDHIDSLADDMLREPGNSNLQQQLSQQMQQTSSTNLPTSVDNPQLVNQNGLIQVLAQAVQQQRQHHQQQQQQQQQQLILQSNLGQNPLGQLLQTTQTPLQPASLDGLTGLSQLLAQAQQQQQQLILLQHLLNQQNVLSSDSLQSNLSSLAPSSASQGMLPSNGILLGGASSTYSSAPQSAPAANNNISQNLQQSNLPNALMLGSMLSNLQNQPNNIGMPRAHQDAQQLDQLQRSLMLQQNQLLASILTASNQLVAQPQQQQPTRQLIALLGQIQNSQNPPPINAQPSANFAAAVSTRQEDCVDEEHSVSEEKSA